jgi:hypothetical protein
MDPETGRALMLAGVLPTGTDRYVALYSGDPRTTGSEIALAGYARVAHQNWATTVPSVGTSERANTTDITFATITGLGVTDYWAIFDAAVAGNLLRVGPITDIFGTPTPVVFSGGGDDLRFLVGAIRIRVEDV